MKTILTTLALALAAGPALADDAAMDQALLGYQHQWEHINYELPADQKAAAFETLAKQEETLVQHYPNRAEPLIWHGIILSSLAGAERSLGALGLAKKARDELVASEKIDPTALQGSADASLGTLYYRVPGWPIGFGDDDKAEAYLKKAVQIDPNGIDSNYLYADFLYGKHRYPEAMQALKRALAAPSRPSRPLADKGRRQEIMALMAKVREKVGDSQKSAEL
jgi:tetratricopeptide (TPR) repeat protein